MGNMLEEMINDRFSGSVLDHGQAPEAALGVLSYKLSSASRASLAMQALTLLGLRYAMEYTRTPTERGGGAARESWVITLMLPEDCINLGTPVAQTGEPKRGPGRPAKDTRE